MGPEIDGLFKEVSRLWRASPMLTAVGLGVLPILAFSLLGIVLDDRLITGSPAWLKPSKFAVSISVYCLTLALIVSRVERPTRLLRWSGIVIAIVLLGELAIIDLQAARGTTSHFNTSTGLDGAIYGVMGISIAILLLASALVSFDLFRASFRNRVWGWTIRLGMLITVIGAAMGGMMLKASEAQTVEARTRGISSTTGAHTVGGLDGGPGLPVTGWSRNHGDLRVPHFFGLHAIQAIPLLAWVAFRVTNPRTDRTRIALVAWISASYLAAIGLLMAQAMAGRPIFDGNGLSMVGLGIWATLTFGGVGGLLVRDRTQVGFASIARTQGA